MMLLTSTQSGMLLLGCAWFNRILMDSAVLDCTMDAAVVSSLSLVPKSSSATEWATDRVISQLLAIWSVTYSVVLLLASEISWWVWWH
jgi:hypothetical protein